MSTVAKKTIVGVSTAIKNYLESSKVASNVKYYQAGSDTVSGVMVFTDAKLMEEKGYKTIAIDYTDETGYVFTILKNDSTYFEIKPEDKPCLLGLFHVEDLDKLYSVFKEEGVTAETLERAENESIFLKYYYQSENVA